MRDAAPIGLASASASQATNPLDAHVFYSPVNGVWSEVNSELAMLAVGKAVPAPGGAALAVCASGLMIRRRR